METDTLRTWGVKNLPERIIELINDAAKREGLTNAEWLERRVEEWLNAGSPMRLNPVVPDATYLQAHAAYLHAVSALNHSIVELDRAPDSPSVKTARISARRLLLTDRRRIAAPVAPPTAPP